MEEPALDSRSHAEPRSHRDVLAPAGENDNDCLLREKAVQVAFLECNFATMRAVHKIAGPVRPDCNFAVYSLYCGIFEDGGILT